MSSDARSFASGKWLHWRERAGREVGSTALLLREEAAAPRGDRVTRIGGWWENSTLPVRPLRSSTVVRKDGSRERDDGGSEARSSCPEGWLTLQKLRCSRRSSSEGPALLRRGKASQGRDARTGEERDGVKDASGPPETGTVSRGSVEET